MADFPPEHKEIEEVRLISPFPMTSTSDVESYIRDNFTTYEQMQEEIYRLNRVVQFLFDKIEILETSNKPSKPNPNGTRLWHF